MLENNEGKKEENTPRENRVAEQEKGPRLKVNQSSESMLPVPQTDIDISDAGKSTVSSANSQDGTAPAIVSQGGANTPMTQARPRRRHHRRAANILSALALILVLGPLALAAIRVCIDPARMMIGMAFLNGELMPSPGDASCYWLHKSLALKDDPCIRYICACSEEKRYEYAAAESDLAALEDTPFFTSEVAYRLAMLKIRRGLYDNDTRQCLLKVMQSRGFSTNWGYCSVSHVAGAFLIAGDFNEALAAVSVEGTAGSDWFTPEVMQAQALEELGRRTEAKEILDHLISKGDGGFGFAQWHRALWYLDNGKPGNALRDTDEGLKDGQDEAILVRAWCMLKQENLTDALALSDKVLAPSRPPSNPLLGCVDLDLLHMSAHRLRAVAYSKLGEHGRVAAEYKLSKQLTLNNNIYTPKEFRNWQP